MVTYQSMKTSRCHFVCLYVHSVITAMCPGGNWGGERTELEGHQTAVTLSGSTWLALGKWVGYTAYLEVT